MKIAKIFRRVKTPLYAIGLILTTERKTCTNIANRLSVSHDRLYRQLHTRHKQSTTNDLKQLARNTFQEKSVCLILDDTRINKPYAELIEGLDIGHDGSTNSSTKGLQMVTAMLTDLNISLPIDIKPYISKWLIPENYRTKSEIGWHIVKSLMLSFDIERVLADAHYATKTFLSELLVASIPFLMKIPRNRAVIIDGRCDQLQHILKLRRNEHTRCVQGLYDGLPYYFYVVKIRNGTTIYFVSSDYIEKNDLLNLYRIRWNIEIFHRTVKQKFGLQDCQTRKLENQLAHALFIMHAYAIAELNRAQLGLRNIEASLRHLRNLKLTPYQFSNVALVQDFEYYA